MTKEERFWWAGALAIQWCGAVVIMLVYQWWDWGDGLRAYPLPGLNADSVNDSGYGLEMMWRGLGVLVMAFILALTVGLGWVFSEQVRSPWQAAKPSPFWATPSRPAPRDGAGVPGAEAFPNMGELPPGVGVGTGQSRDAGHPSLNPSPSPNPSGRSGELPPDPTGNLWRFLNRTRNIPVGIWVGREGARRAWFCNRTFAEIFGDNLLHNEFGANREGSSESAVRMPGAIPLWPWKERILAEDREIFAEHQRKLMSGEISSCEFRVERVGTRARVWVRELAFPVSSGAPAWNWQSGTPLPFTIADGVVGVSEDRSRNARVSEKPSQTYMIGIVEDVSEYHIEQDRLEFESDLALFLCSRECMLGYRLHVQDRQFRLALVSRKDGSFLGHALNAFTDNGDFFLDIIHPNDRMRFHQGLVHSGATLTVFQADYRVRNANGDYHWVANRAWPQRLDDNRIAWDGCLMVLSRMPEVSNVPAAPDAFSSVSSSSENSAIPQSRGGGNAYSQTQTQLKLLTDIMSKSPVLLYLVSFGEMSCVPLFGDIRLILGGVFPTPKLQAIEGLGLAIQLEDQPRFQVFLEQLRRDRNNPIHDCDVRVAVAQDASKPMLFRGHVHHRDEFGKPVEAMLCVLERPERPS